MKYWKLSPWDWEWNRISIITLLFSIVLKSFSQSIQLLSWVRLFAIPWTAGRQASLSSTNSWSLLKLMSIESVMPNKPTETENSRFYEMKGGDIGIDCYWAQSFFLEWWKCSKIRQWCGIPWWSSGKDSALRMQRTQAWSLIRALDPTCRI